MGNIVTSRMVAHPCKRYQWYASQGFPDFDPVNSWKYDLNSSIESWGSKFFEYNLWVLTKLDYQYAGGLRTSRLFKVAGLSEALDINLVNKNQHYILYCRSLGTSAYRRIQTVKKIHKVNVNLTLEAMLNYHILSLHSIVYEPLVIFIDRGSLSYHIEPLFNRISNYESIAKSYFETTTQVIASPTNVFEVSESPYHCSRCIFRKQCQADLLNE